MQKQNEQFNVSIDKHYIIMEDKINKFIISYKPSNGKLTIFIKGVRNVIDIPKDMNCNEFFKWCDENESLFDNFEDW